MSSCRSRRFSPGERLSFFRLSLLGYSISMASLHGIYLTFPVFPLDISPQYKYNGKAYRGVAKFGIALGSGPRGLGFESPHSDQR